MWRVGLSRKGKRFVFYVNEIIPCVYALLPNKTRATCAKMLLKLKNVQPGLTSSKPPCRQIKMLSSLEFVEPDNVVQAYEELTRKNQFRGKSMKIANYFEEILTLGKNSDVADVADCCMECSSADFIRYLTYHYRLAASLPVDPSIYRFIDFLKKQQAAQNYDAVQLLMSNPGNSRNKAISQQIKTIVQTLNGNVTDRY
ncbi:hypothetical protein HELRODRAFT_169549 [Helobdella robusta]|uniref:Uncharacterized protein n=1 Tax=Helobdella robusta TaxID=6412 RepID=T1F231_HELRO|nr:hypothetical protein HELRODRAFT_169549 [Helobdella robusta]ESO08661.1 hypothetical protein HELRODRAFT_169549 [Helobdella robusta]